MKNENLIENWHELKHDLQMKGKHNYTQDEAYSGA